MCRPPGRRPACLALFLAATLLLPLSAAASPKYKVLYSFKGGSDGAWPWTNLVFDTAGNIYGGTVFGGGDTYCQGGGYSGCGTVFELARNSDGTWRESVLHAFQYTDGAEPQGGFVFDAAGSLYGTTFIGGEYSNGDGETGTVFRLTPSSSGWTSSVIYAFCNREGCSNGYQPRPALVQDAAGDLYGTTALGGDGGFDSGGVIFQLVPGSTGWTENVLYSFCHPQNCFNEGVPDAGLIWDAQGNLYGTTTAGGLTSFPCGGRGCGTVFKLAPGANGKWSYSVLYKFNGVEGAYPGAVIFDIEGNLYGTTRSGGAFDYGTAFKLAPAASGRWKSTVLYNFRAHANSYPLVLDAAGNLYGTTWDGGVEYCNGDAGCGEVYRLTPGGKYGRWRLRSLYKFSGKQDGGFPQGGVIFDGKGNLYGTAVLGGTHGDGVVFELTP